MTTLDAVTFASLRIAFCVPLTTAVTTYGTTSAAMGGEVTASGGESVTERGVVYSFTDATPTIV